MSPPPLRLIGLFIFSTSQATILFLDRFETNGKVATSSPAVGNPWEVHSGTGNEIESLSGKLSLTHGSGSREDLRGGFTPPITQGSLFASFDFSVAKQNTAFTGSNHTYFFHLMRQSNGSNFRAELVLNTPSGSGDFGISLKGDVNTPDLPWATDLSYDTNYQVVIKYNNENNNYTRLWINPTDENSAHIQLTDGFSDATLPNAVALRQADSSNDETIFIDNLVIATTFAEASSTSTVPEPSTSALLLTSGIIISLRRNPR